LDSEESFLGRVIHTTNPTRQRNALMRRMASAIRTFASSSKTDDDEKSLTERLAACLREIQESVERTAVAWEKRDYWVKADAFRRQWSWVEGALTGLSNSSQSGDLSDLKAIIRAVEERTESAGRAGK
jgi:FAD/FMN-containing dehydrogenase